METSGQKFIKWFQEFYSHEYPSLSNQFKFLWIEYIINHNGEYISEDFIQQHQDFCNMCGLCCENQFKDCEYFNVKTKLCDIHDNQPWDVCKQYPYGVLDMIAPVTINCMYMIRIFISFFDKFFAQLVSQKGNMNNYIIKPLESSDILTIFGKAKIDKNGYYVITSRREGFHHQKLHRLIWEDCFGEIDENFAIHHIDHNKINNNIDNLEIMNKTDHIILHRKYDSAIYNLNKEDVIKKYQELGSIKKTAKFFDIHPQTMGIFFKKNNIPKDVNYKRDILDFSQVLNCYNKTKSLRKTAEYFNCSRETIRVLLKEHNIDLYSYKQESDTKYLEIRRHKNSKSSNGYTYVYYINGVVDNKHRVKTSIDINILIKWAQENQMPLTLIDKEEKDAS